jgi:hypothetical protein
VTDKKPKKNHLGVGGVPCMVRPLSWETDDLCHQRFELGAKIFLTGLDLDKTHIIIQCTVFVCANSLSLVTAVFLFFSVKFPGIPAESAGEKEWWRVITQKSMCSTVPKAVGAEVIANLTNAMALVMPVADIW